MLLTPHWVFDDYTAVTPDFLRAHGVTLLLIAPTFTHAENSFSGKVRAFFMKLAGLPLHSRWTSGE